ncbi:hypothetical protein BQ8482_280075 [Mesorhizobium delmotii]|uniref:Uncharacterized protein n=1 Tax=Mesorhizobium delmotii TaxID=1631247 RepID=A0A2P9AMH8_9HYPH|nr:hypothetical protein BQ8482_280075 [Mesorhizobium delmotii]
MRFCLRLVSSAKHHSGAVSSDKTIAINGAGWPISDTFAAFPVECEDAPSPRRDNSA